MKTTPYLFFGGKCEEAVAFYHEALGAEVRALVRFADLPGANAETQDRVMHAELGFDDGTIFASDGQGDGRQGTGFAISLEARDDDEAERLFAILAAEGTIGVPLMTTPFASRFGMATDRFGTPWMITTPQAPLA
jgi:PhnB protein